MIAKHDMMSVLLDACPSFQPAWNEWLANWSDESDDLPLYLALNELSRHLIGMLERSETSNFPSIFQAIERLQTEGDPYVREAAIIGLLENLQNLNLHTTTEPEQFRPFLEQNSVEAWDELYAFWHRVRLAKAAGQLEPESNTIQQSDPDSIKDPELRRLVQHLYRRT